MTTRGALAGTASSPIRQLPRHYAWTAVGLAVLLILAVYESTVRSIVDIWSRSQTFTHGFLVVPAVLWLCWRSRDRLAATSFEPCYAALAGVALAALGWLAAQQVGVLGGQQFMLVTAIVFTIWAVAGTAVVRVLAFPLAYLFLAVPFGEIEPGRDSTPFAVPLAMAAFTSLRSATTFPNSATSSMPCVACTPSIQKLTFELCVPPMSGDQ